MFTLLALFACAGHPGVTAEVPAATVATETPPSTLGVSLHGDRLATPVPVPMTTRVLAMDGTPRDRSALLGKPTALWFYPAAGTPG